MASSAMGGRYLIRSPGLGQLGVGDYLSLYYSGIKACIGTPTNEEWDSVLVDDVAGGPSMR